MSTENLKYCTVQINTTKIQPNKYRQYIDFVSDVGNNVELKFNKIIPLFGFPTSCNNFFEYDKRLNGYNLALFDF